MRFTYSFWALLLLLVGSSIAIFNIPKTNIKEEGVGNISAVKGIGSDNVEVKNIVDGDTVILADDTRVRLIGINSPEENQPYYEESKKKLESLLMNKFVDLVSDEDAVDQYGRKLKYIYLGDTHINYEMVKSGLSMVEIISPNVSHAAELNQAQSYARDKCLGIWEGLCMPDVSSCIQVSAVMQDAKADDSKNKNSEWVEIMNTCSSQHNLLNYLVKDLSAQNSYTFKNFVLGPKKRVKIHSGCSIDTATDVYWQCPEKESAIWNNSGDTVYLYDNFGKLVSSIGY
ncbi:MAG: thermonuclease family protein [Candidatus Levybacteria bacterium]|nr:thermonuclease family protein [Candidatus Levybacteria bacterium]MBP9815250.1 thermonuclease family protein [Candidatus Levybacteria bacterium]